MWGQVNQDNGEDFTASLSVQHKNATGQNFRTWRWNQKTMKSKNVLSWEEGDN